MSFIDDPDFVKRADEAASIRQAANKAREEAAEVEAERQRRQQLVRDEQAQATSADADRQRQIARELAERAVQRGLKTNRQWVISPHRTGIARILPTKTSVIKGWMLVHHDSRQEMDMGEVSYYGSDLALLTNGMLVVTGIGHSSGVDLQAHHRSVVGRDRPAEYVQELARTTEGMPPWEGFGLDEVRRCLAEFAGVNRLVANSSGASGA